MVTGGSSLLARRTVEALVGRGDDVVSLQRNRAPVDVRQVLADIRNRAAVLDAARGCDAIIHAAAKVGVVGTWEEYRSINIDGTEAVLAAAQQHGCRVVHVSTPSVAHAGRSLVGEVASSPIIGRSGSFYAESKARAELLAIAASSNDLPVVAIRPHLVWGPGDTQLVGRIVERARAGRLALVGSGAALVDTTYIDNAASAVVAGLDAAVPGAVCAGKAYVISNNEPRPVGQLFLAICEAAGVAVEPRHIPRKLAAVAGGTIEAIWRLASRVGRGVGEPPLTRFLAEQLGTAHWFDPRPARDDLGWSPHVSIDDGMARLAEWFATGAR